MLQSESKPAEAQKRILNLSDRDFPSLTAAAGKLAESSLLIDDTAGLSISELRAKARRFLPDPRAPGQPDSRQILSSMCLLQLPESWHEACTTSVKMALAGLFNHPLISRLPIFAVPEQDYALLI